MAEWKTDRLVRLVFEEIRALWEELRMPDGPLLFRVEERHSQASTKATWPGRLVNVWLFDDHGIRLAPILRREAHDFGELRSGYHRYGLVQFGVSDDRTRVTMNYCVGPNLGGEIVYDVLGDLDQMELQALSDTLSR